MLLLYSAQTSSYFPAKEYTEGLLDHVTILIGIAVGDDAAAGVVHQPYYNYKAKRWFMGMRTCIDALLVLKQYDALLPLKRGNAGFYFYYRWAGRCTASWARERT